MIHKYKNVSIIYGGNGRRYAKALSERISLIANEERYPIQSKIINEQILTCELLTDVMRLFKESEFCVAFLTKEDRCFSENARKMRLRQNVVFEIGMALIELGRERCILLSDFNVKDPEFDLPSDMNSLEILQFDSNNYDIVLKNITDKILKLSQNSIRGNFEYETTPQYDNLLARTKYWIDYENLFAERPLDLASEGKEFFNDTLSYWINECQSLPHYDEKCIYLVERIGFLPFFGKTSYAVNFMKKAEKLIESYRPSDIEYYGSSKLLDFTKNLLQCAIDYTVLKTIELNFHESVQKYKSLLHNMVSDGVPNINSINPLMLVAYYDYLGLIYFRLYRGSHNIDYLKSAEHAFLKSLEYVSSIDMSMQVWSGFISYNLARVYSECNDIDNAEKYYNYSIKIRTGWLKTSNYTITIRNAMSYEYFIAKIDYIDMRQKIGLLSPNEAQIEYNYVEKELNAYSDADSELNQLIYIRQMLNDRKPTV